MNDPDRVVVRAGPVRSGSAASPDPVTPNEVLDDEVRLERPGVLEWVPRGAPTNGADYPIESGVPHPHWVPEQAEHRISAGRIAIDESAAVVRVLVALAVIAFLLGLTIFYPVSPLGH